MMNIVERLSNLIGGLLVQPPFYFGDWIKEQRDIYGLSQAKLSGLTNGKIKQSTISMWESREVLTPSIHNIWSITNALGIPLSNVPWDYLDFNENEKGCVIVKERFRLYDLPNANSVRTFEGNTYDLIGSVGIEKATGEVRHVTDLYYRAKTVVSDSKILARRKNEDAELIFVDAEKRKKSRVR